MRRDQLFSALLLLILAGAAVLVGSPGSVPWPLPVEAPTGESPRPDEASDTVVRVVDGDTIGVAGLPDSVRLIGIDTPELDDPRPRQRCLARLAKERIDSLTSRRKVRLVRDVLDRDRYRRLLRYVYLPDGRLVNLVMVEEGYATVLTVPPNVRLAPLFLSAQSTARRQERGLWNPSVCS